MSIDSVHQAMFFLLNAMAFIGGLVIAYLAAFSYENEDGKIQDTLEEWWIYLEDKKSDITELLSEFINKSSSLCNDLFNYLFGKDVFSYNVFAGLTIYTLAAIWFIFCFIALFITITSSIIAFIVTCFFCLYFSLFILGWVIDQEERKPIVIIIWVILLFGCYRYYSFVAEPFKLEVLAIINNEETSYTGSRIFPILALSALIGIVTNSLLITLSRLVYRSKERITSSFIYIFIIVILFASVSLVAIGAPLTAIKYSENIRGNTIIEIKNDVNNTLKGFDHEKELPEYKYIAELLYEEGIKEHTSTLEMAHMIKLTGYTSIITNLPSILSSLAFILISSTLLFGKALFPVLSRLIYACHRYQIVDNKKFLWSISTSLLLISTGGQLHSFIKNIINTLNL